MFTRLLCICLFLVAPVYATTLYYNEDGSLDHEKINQSIITENDRLYFDEEDMRISDDAFYLHQGGNVWVHTGIIHRDTTGLYTYQSSLIRHITRPGLEAQAQKYWKCPYCHRYWKQGEACQNKECPSRYK